MIHDTAVIGDRAHIGVGSKMWCFSHIEGHVGIGCTIGMNVYIAEGAVVGTGCKIQNGVNIFKGVTLEDGVFCGPGVTFTNVIDPRAFISKKHEFKSTLVRKRATLGANSTILCGVKIGVYAMVGAGAVIVKDVPAYGLVIGNPAELIGYVCECGKTLRGANCGCK